MTNYNYDLTVFIGRFQILHYGHLAVILEAFKQSRYVCILIGSAHAARSYRNPFTFEERKQMILSSIDKALHPFIKIEPIEDYTYNEDMWLKTVQKTVWQIKQEILSYDHMNENNFKIALIGHNKDNSSYYLKLFPQWNNIAVTNYKNISSTQIRKVYFSNITDMWLNDCDGHKTGDLPQDQLVTTSVKDFLKEFNKTSDWKLIKEEYDFITKYKLQWINSPYPPIFVTVDTCVIQSGHILLVKRNGMPGKGLWALPGGFIHQDEKLIDSAIRELREETKIAVPEPVLRGSMIDNRVFDDPNRSSRGRTITHVFLINLKPMLTLPEIRNKSSNLPKVEGGDDAAKAKWIQFSDLKREMMFEDHYDIISTMLSINGE